MTHDEFWDIIADSRRDFDPDRRNGNMYLHGNMYLQAERLKQLLTPMPADEVQAFDRVFRQLFFDAFKWDLWAAAYIIGGGCCDDSFMDFRFWLISMGREVYEAAMVDAESLADVAAAPGIELTFFEAFGYIAAGVLEEKGASVPAEPYPHPEKPTGERWPHEEDPMRLPKLWARFGEADA